MNNNESVKTTCPNCGSENINYQAVPILSRKKGCLWWLFIGWWWWIIELIFWVFATLPMLIASLIVHEEKTTRVDFYAVCQDCGYGWRVKYKTNKKAKLIRSFITIGFILLFLVIVIPSNQDSSDQGAEDPNAIYTQVAGTMMAEANRATDIPTPEPTEPITAPPFQTIQDNVDNMTEVQWKEYLPTLEGMKVENWIGWVVDVDKSYGDEYKIWVDMDDPSVGLSTQDVYLYGIAEEEATTINKGAQIYFTGIISDTSEFFGDVTIDIENVSYQIQ